MGPPRSRYFEFADRGLGLRVFPSTSPLARKLLVFPCAGGSSLFYSDFAHRLGPGWAPAAIDPPGHGWASGTPAASIDDLAELAITHLPAKWLDGCVFLGESMGGYAAYATAARLEEQSRSAAAVALVATRPPHCHSRYSSFLSLTDDELVRRLIELGSIPPEWANEPATFTSFSRILRADFGAFETFSPAAPLQRTAILAIGASGDSICRAQEMQEWSGYAPRFLAATVDGGHLVLHNQAGPIVDELNRFLKSPGPGARHD